VRDQAVTAAPLLLRARWHGHRTAPVPQTTPPAQLSPPAAGPPPQKPLSEVPWVYIHRP